MQIVDGTVDVLDDALTREFGHVGIDGSVKIFGGVTQHGVGVALVAMEQRRGDRNITRSGKLVGHALDVWVCAEGFLHHDNCRQAGPGVGVGEAHVGSHIAAFSDIGTRLPIEVWHSNVFPERRHSIFLLQLLRKRRMYSVHRRKKCGCLPAVPPVRWNCNKGLRPKQAGIDSATGLGNWAGSGLLYRIAIC